MSVYREHCSGDYSVYRHILSASYSYAPASDGPGQTNFSAAADDHPDFLFKLKHDGFRALAYIVDGHCELFSRQRNCYKSFGELRAHLAGLKVKDAVIDSELVCLDAEGRQTKH